VAEASLALILASFLASIFKFTFTTLAAAFLTAALAFTIFARIAAFFANGAALRAFLRAVNFFTAFSWATNAFFFSGDLVFASAFLIAAILALVALDFLSATTFETLRTLALILTNLALAALSCFFIAAFFALEAVRSYFLRAATFFWALSWATNAFFLLGSVAAEILALIKAIRLASTLACVFNTYFEALANLALAALSLASKIFFSSG